MVCKDGCMPLSLDRLVPPSDAVELQRPIESADGTSSKLGGTPDRGDGRNAETVINSDLPF